MPQVQCPTCAKLCEFSPGNPWRPFCSERCRSIDLGAWASERFRIARTSDADDSTAEAPTDKQAPPTGG